MRTAEPTPFRPRLTRVLELADGFEVLLTLRGESVTGRAEKDDSGQLVAVARAALRAVDALTPSTVSFDLDWLTTLDPPRGLPRVVTVVVTATIAGVPMPQTGSALVREDVESATAKAVLAALNRRLEILQV